MCLRNHDRVAWEHGAKTKNLKFFKKYRSAAGKEECELQAKYDSLSLSMKPVKFGMPMNILRY